VSAVALPSNTSFGNKDRMIFSRIVTAGSLGRRNATIASS
jgi:hypothetical protein